MMRRRIPVLLVAVLHVVAAQPASAAALHPERAYQERWCERNNGVAEVTLADRTRVDCLTTTHAVEVDFAHKWAEAVGQSLYYAGETGHAPAVVLILERPGDGRFLRRLNAAVRGTGIAVWTITPEDME